MRIIMYKKMTYEETLRGFISLYGEEWMRLPKLTRLNIKIGCFLSSYGIYRWHFTIIFTICITIYAILKLGDLISTVEMAVRLSLVTTVVAYTVIINYISDKLILHIQIIERVANAFDLYVNFVSGLNKNDKCLDEKASGFNQSYHESREEIKNLLLIKFTKL